MLLVPPEEEFSKLVYRVERIFEGVDRRGYSMIKATLYTANGARPIRITRACTAVRMRWRLAEDFDPDKD